MSQIYVGTSYNQVYRIPLNLKSPILKYGQKKKNPVTSIYLPYADQQLKQDIFMYSTQSQSILISKITQQQQSVLTVQMEPNQKILTFQGDKKAYYTSYGNIYYQSKQNKWCKFFYNDMYNNTIKSLPPQRIGKLQPQYTRAITQTSGNNIQVGFVGRGLLPFVYQLQQTTSMIAWRAKNVKNDFLDLQVPINDVDLCFLKNGYLLAAANVQNMVRIYDVKSRRRKPIQDITLNQIIKFQKSNLTRMIKSQCQNYLFVGNHRGSIYQLDLRKNLAVSGKIKGITTTIKDIQIFQQHLATISLDGYLRIFNTTTKQKQFERYLNTHPQVLKLTQYGINFQSEQLYKQQQIDLNNDNEEVDQNQKKKQYKMKKIKKRNKVGLKYVENAKFDDIKIQNQQQPKQQQQNPKYQDQDLDL